MKRISLKFNHLKMIIICLTAFVLLPIYTFAKETVVFESQNFISTQKTQMDQSIDPDDYEEDDSFSQANVVQLIDPSVVELLDPSVVELIDFSPQNHNFHDAGDQDWVKFYGIKDEPYEVKVSNVGANCDVVINIYDSDGTALLRDMNWGFEGEDELLTWRCPKNGIYYVMIQHFGSSVVGFGENATYDLVVYRPIGTIPGFIVGTVTDTSTGTAISGAVIVTDGGGSAISLPNGSYLMIERAGTYTMTVIVSNVAVTSYAGIVVDEGGITTKDIELQNSTEFESATYFPHIASDNSWETEICIINTGFQQNLSGELTAYNNSGQEIDSKPVFLGPKARREIIVGYEFFNASHIEYIVFESDSENVRGYTKFYIDGKYRVAIPAASEFVIVYHNNRSL